MLFFRIFYAVAFVCVQEKWKLGSLDPFQNIVRMKERGRYTRVMELQKLNLNYYVICN